VLEARVPDGRGSLARPLPATAIIDKFRDNAARALPHEQVREIEQLTLGLDTLPDVRTLARRCRG
jgi:hypothetical protein